MIRLERPKMAKKKFSPERSCMPLEVLAIHSNCFCIIVSDRLEVISKSEAVVEQNQNADRLAY